MSLLKVWIEAMRLRTLPVSVAGVTAGTACAVACGSFEAWPAVLCVLFAVLAQIASNFANEYYDYVSGIDRKGRQGPRRGVTEGDITPGAMKTATYLTLAAACAVGLSLIAWGGWWLVAVGAVIAIGVLAYSTGPYPLSRHALGEVAVIFFFGIIPVNFTFYLQAGVFDTSCFLVSVAIGLMGANVLIVNNYRDRYDDLSAGKTTLATLLGPRTVSNIYLFNGYIAVALMMDIWLALPRPSLAVPCLYLMAHTSIWHNLRRLEGAALTPLLGATAVTMFLYSLLLLLCVAL